MGKFFGYFTHSGTTKSLDLTSQQLAEIVKEHGWYNAIVKQVNPKDIRNRRLRNLWTRSRKALIGLTLNLGDDLPE